MEMLASSNRLSSKPWTAPCLYSYLIPSQHIPLLKNAIRTVETQGFFSGISVITCLCHFLWHTIARRLRLHGSWHMGFVGKSPVKSLGCSAPVIQIPWNLNQSSGVWLCSARESVLRNSWKLFNILNFSFLKTRQRGDRSKCIEKMWLFILGAKKISATSLLL